MEDIPLRKYKKKVLIRMVENYENDISELQEQIKDMNMNNRIEKEYIVLRNEEEDKTIQYIKRRLLIIQDTHRRAIYQIELNRLLNVGNEKLVKV